jgi:hypothetical protein
MDQIEKLTRDLREMDQLVYQMQTAGSADQLRFAVSRAWAITEQRMRVESDRIANVLIPEIKKAYTNPALNESPIGPSVRTISPPLKRLR